MNHEQANFYLRIDHDTNSFLHVKLIGSVLRVLG